MIEGERERERERERDCYVIYFSYKSHKQVIEKHTGRSNKQKTN